MLGVPGTGGVTGRCGTGSRCGVGAGGGSRTGGSGLSGGSGKTDAYCRGTWCVVLRCSMGCVVVGCVVLRMRPYEQRATVVARCRRQV